MIKATKIQLELLDIEPPSFQCPSNMTVTTDEGVSYATVNIALPQATDNSGSTPIVWSRPAADKTDTLSLPVGVNEVQIHGMDASENSIFCSFYIEVKGKYFTPVIKSDVCRQVMVFLIKLVM